MIAARPKRPPPLRIADVFHRAATDLEEMAGTAHAYDPGTLRHKIWEGAALGRRTAARQP